MLKAVVVECTYLLYYPTSMHAVCMCVKGKHTFSCWQVVGLYCCIRSGIWYLHWNRRENTLSELIPTCLWNEDIVKMGQLVMSTPWQQMSASLPASSSACTFQILSFHTSSSLPPVQLHEDGNENITSNTHHCKEFCQLIHVYVLLVSSTIVNIHVVLYTLVVKQTHL